MVTKRQEKKLDGNYTRMLQAILNKSWWQHPTKHQLYGHLPPITKTIQVRRTRHVEHFWRKRNELISDVLLWTPTYGRASYVRIRDVALKTCQRWWNDREKWRERVRDVRAIGTKWWWWWWWWRWWLNPGLQDHWRTLYSKIKNISNYLLLKYQPIEIYFSTKFLRNFIGTIQFYKKIKKLW